MFDIPHMIDAVPKTSVEGQMNLVSYTFFSNHIPQTRQRMEHTHSSD